MGVMVIAMENILREFSYLPCLQFGCLTKIVLHYVAYNELPNEVEDESMIPFFENFVQKRLDRIVQQRLRSEKNRKEKKEAQA